MLQELLCQIIHYQIDLLFIAGNVKNNFQDPIKRGDKLGTLDIINNDEVVLEKLYLIKKKENELAEIKKSYDSLKEEVTTLANSVEDANVLYFKFYTKNKALMGSGDLTVDTSTLKVDSTNNRVGIGITSGMDRDLHIKAQAVIQVYKQKKREQLSFEQLLIVQDLISMLKERLL